MIDEFEINSVLGIFDFYFIEEAKSLPEIFFTGVVTLLSGIFLPLFVLYFTVWTELYRKLFDNYALREAIFLKNENILSDIVLQKGILEKHDYELSLDSAIVPSNHIVKKNVQDIESLPFERLVEAFHYELDQNIQSFRRVYKDYNDSIGNVAEFQNHFPVFLLEYNGQIIDLFNSNVEVFAVARDICIRKINELYPEDVNYSYWININSHLTRIIEMNGFPETELKAEFYSFKETIQNANDIDYISADLVKQVEKIIENYELVESSIKELKGQIQTYTEIFDQALLNISSFQSFVRTRKPNKLHFWRYFTD